MESQFKFKINLAKCAFLKTKPNFLNLFLVWKMNVKMF